MPFIPTTQLNQAGAGGMVLISDTLLGVDTATFNFPSIPASYKHLKIIAYLRNTRTPTVFDIVRIQFNGDTAGNYFNEIQASFTTTLTGQHETSVAGGYTECTTAGSPANVFAAIEIIIPNYVGTVGYKSYLAASSGLKDTNAPHHVDSGGTWTDTSPINRIVLDAENGDFLAGSRVSLYGLN